MVRSIVGIIALLAVAAAFSSDRKRINLRTVSGAFILQIFFGWFVLATPFGSRILLVAAEAATALLKYGDAGIEFLFGSLVNSSIEGLGFIFAFKILPLIIFVSALVSVLYYCGIMQWVINIIGGVLHKTIGSSKAESTSAAANIFLGPTDAPLLVRPYIPQMTRSEFFAVMSGGLATIAGPVMVGYAAMGIPMNYLLAASFMAAPGGLLFAKLLIPETEAPVETLPVTTNDEQPANVINAAVDGAANGLQVASLVGASLIAFIGLISLLNALLSGAGDVFGIENFTLEFVLGQLLAPVAWVIGVPWEEASIAGSFIGEKLVLNEFVAYMNFLAYLKDETLVVTTNAFMSGQTKAIITFALCGFANFSSISLVVGTLGALAPQKTGIISKLGMKVLFASTLSNLMSATIAGLFLSF